MSQSNQHSPSASCHDTAALWSSLVPSARWCPVVPTRGGCWCLLGVPSANCLVVPTGHCAVLPGGAQCSIGVPGDPLGSGGSHCPLYSCARCLVVPIRNAWCLLANGAWSGCLFPHQCLLLSATAHCPSSACRFPVGQQHILLCDDDDDDIGSLELESADSDSSSENAPFH